MSRYQDASALSLIETRCHPERSERATGLTSASFAEIGYRFVAGNNALDAFSVLSVSLW
jgi:hypothetical protein